jgi:trimethylamine-N-oxide reductase (cytochrome c)
LVDNFPDDMERPPIPQWVIGGPGKYHDESIDVENGAERCKTYPLLVISNHPRWRLHAEMDDNAWLREIPTCKIKGPDGYAYEPVWINPSDAEARGIKNGDIVSMYNERGTVLSGAYVTERIRPGAVYQDHGARIDMVVDGPDEYIDRGGANNLICPDHCLSPNTQGQVGSGFLVEIKKADLDALRGKYPESFNKEYDPETGITFNSWVEGGMD